MARIISRPWAEENDRRLLQLRDQGLSTIKIGVTLKRTAKAVTSRLPILPKKKKTDQDSITMKRGKPFVSEDLLIATIAGLLAWIITLALRAALGG